MDMEERRTKADIENKKARIEAEVCIVTIIVNYIITVN